MRANIGSNGGTIPPTRIRGIGAIWSDGKSCPICKSRSGSRRRIICFGPRRFSARESEWLDALCAETAGQKELPVKVLRESPLAQQRRTILRWLQNRGVKDISFNDVEAVRGLLENRIPAKINLSAGKFARRREGKIFVE